MVLTGELCSHVQVLSMGIYVYKSVEVPSLLQVINELISQHNPG